MIKQTSGNDVLPFEKWLALTDSMAEDKYDTEYSFYLKGNSMLPFIRNDRDRVTVVRANAGDVSCGDIVMIDVKTADTDYVVHRLVKKRDNAVLTMGDGNLSPDPWLNGQAILCRVVRVKRGKRTYPADGFIMKSYGIAWRMLLPVRAPLLRLFGRIGTKRKHKR